MKHLFSVVLLMVMMAATGCVTTTISSPGGNKEVDKQRVVADHVELGMNYIGTGNRESARFHFNKALEVDSRSAGAYNGLAILNQLDREDELAEENFRKAISFDGGYTRARFNYAVYLYGRERFLDAYHQFVIVGRDHDYDRRAQVFLNQGLCLMKLSRRDEAKDAFEKSIALDPRLAHAYLELSDYHFADGDYPRAKKMLKTFDRLSEPTARSLWLSVRLARIYGARDEEASRGLALKKLFSDSRENLEYQQWLRADE